MKLPGGYVASVTEHYKTHLAPIYVWMVGGFKAAIERGEAEIAGMLSDLPFGSAVIDLGAGFGMHRRRRRIHRRTTSRHGSPTSRAFLHDGAEAVRPSCATTVHAECAPRGRRRCASIRFNGPSDLTALCAPVRHRNGRSHNAPLRRQRTTKDGGYC